MSRSIRFQFIAGSCLLLGVLGHAADARSVKTAAGVTVRALSPSAALATRKIDQFDVSPRGSILVRCGATLYDFASGARLTTAGTRVRSFAFVQGALAVVTQDGTLGFWRNGALQTAGPVPRGATRLASSESGNQLMLIGDAPNSGVFVFSVGEGLRPLCGAPAPILATACEGDDYRVAIGSSLFTVPEPGSLSLRLALPRNDEPIVGLALAGKATYYATPKAVSSLQGGVSLPLVVGLGGPMRMTTRGLIVLDRGTGRLYRLVGAGIAGRARVTVSERRGRAANGVLEIRLANANLGAEPFFVYIDGRLVHRSGGGAAKPSLRVSLPAGMHRVEAAITIPIRDDSVNFPFLYRREEVQVVSRKLRTVTLDLQADPYAGSWGLSGTPVDGPSREWLDHEFAALQRVRLRMAEDKVVAALIAAGPRLRRHDATDGRVWLDLPEDYGGPREYDREQVTMLAAWLQRLHWTWATPVPRDFLDRMPDPLRQEYDLFLEQVAKEKAVLAGLADPSR